ncbi:retrotransposon protein, putative, ty1-copia subclass [Tanacetum coccineum]
MQYIRFVGGEYISQEFKEYLKANRIVQQLTPPYTPQHNGVSLKENRTLLIWVRSMMNLTTLPYPFGLCSRVWGCEALVKRDTPDKLQQRSVKCIFIGYPKKMMGYYFYFLPENKIVVARYAEFFEKRLISQEISGRLDLGEIQEEKDTTPSESPSNILKSGRLDSRLIANDTNLRQDMFFVLNGGALIGRAPTKYHCNSCYRISNIAASRSSMGSCFGLGNLSQG